MTEREVMKKYQDKVDSYQTAIYLRENPKVDKMERQKINDLKEKLEELKLIANALEKQIGNTTFEGASRRDMLEILLQEEISSIESGEFLEHGYPEQRLIPSNHFSSRRDSLVEEAVERISSEIEELLIEYMDRSEEE